MLHHIRRLFTRHAPWHRSPLLFYSGLSNNHKCTTPRFALPRRTFRCRACVATSLSPVTRACTQAPLEPSCRGDDTAPRPCPLPLSSCRRLWVLQPLTKLSSPWRGISTPTPFPWLSAVLSLIVACMLLDLALITHPHQKMLHEGTSLSR